VYFYSGYFSYGKLSTLNSVTNFNPPVGFNAERHCKTAKFRFEKKSAKSEFENELWNIELTKAKKLNSNSNNE